jgi:hypothetical protein
MHSRLYANANQEAQVSQVALKRGFGDAGSTADISGWRCFLGAMRDLKLLGHRRFGLLPILIWGSHGLARYCRDHAAIRYAMISLLA